MTENVLEMGINIRGGKNLIINIHYTGMNDLCRCFTCDGGLQRWDADDDPWIEHARWFPQCQYVRQIKGQEYINMVQQAAAQARAEEEVNFVAVL
jgi:hypothetical protein